MRIAGLLTIGFLVLGCGEDGASLYIRGFITNTLNLTVGQSHAMKLRLSANVSDVTYVDADYLAYKEFIEVNPEVVKFKSGEGEDGADVTIKGLKATPAGGVDIIFKLRGSTEIRKLTVIVADQVVPDAGPLPDYGPMPDTAGPTPDTGASPDAGGPTPDAAAGD